MPSEITFAEFGGPEVLHWSNDGEMPEPLPSQVVIVVAAASVGNRDARIRSGQVEGFITTFFPSGLGRDAAGVVVAVGRAVRDVQIGDEVLGFTDTCAYAQFAALSSYVRKPATMSWAVAASLPTAVDTAFRVLGELALNAGDTLLIAGGGGAIGSIVTQLAIARGIEVVATVGSGDEAYLRSLGATAVRYGPGWPERVSAASPRGITAALDTAGTRILPDLVSLVGTPLRVITIADNSASLYGVRLSLGNPAVRGGANLIEATALVTSGALSVRMSRTYPLAQAAKAHRDLAAGGTRGRIVLTNGA